MSDPIDTYIYEDDSLMVGNRRYNSEGEALQAAEIRVMGYMEKQHRIKMIQARRNINPNECLSNIYDIIAESKTCKDTDLKRLKFQLDANIALLKVCKI